MAGLSGAQLDIFGSDQEFDQLIVLADEQRFPLRPKQLLEMIDANIGPDRWARLSTRRIAEGLGCSRPTARKDLDDLERAGKIVLELDDDDETRGIVGFRIRLIEPPKTRRRRNG